MTDLKVLSQKLGEVNKILVSKWMNVIWGLLIERQKGKFDSYIKVVQ